MTRPRPTHGVAAKLWKARVAMGLTLAQAAERIGVSTSFLCDIELGRRTPSATTTIEIGRAYRSQGIRDADLWADLAREEFEAAKAARGFP